MERCNIRTSQEESPGKGTGGKKGPVIDGLIPGLTASFGPFAMNSSFNKSLAAPDFRHE
jgi:hypothetical protein